MDNMNSLIYVIMICLDINASLFLCVSIHY